TGANAATVLGGRIWRPDLPPSLDVQTAFVVGGHRVGEGSFTSSARPTSVGDARLVCVCRGGTEAAGLVLSTPARWEGLSRWLGTERLTVLDPLAGVWNRRYLDRALREQVKRHRRFESTFGLLMIDVDRFKRVNDAHGHAAGDAVLVSMSRAIGDALREDL